MINKKMTKKAFTVVELIAVIVVLAIILAITVPGITGIVRSSTMKAVESDAKLVLDAIRLKKIEDDTFDPTNLNKSNVGNLLGLSDENYSALEVKINDGQTYIKITGQGKWSGFSVCGTYFDMQVNEGTCYLDFNDPVITMLGDSFVTINVGDAYSDAGATANDVEDGNITDRIVITGTVNPSVPGTYTITYNVSDTAGREAVSVTRTVYVIDIEAPVITILGNNPITMNVGETYSDAGATALDDADGDVTSRIVTTGTVNPSVVGTYTITYTVSDNAGHEATAVRTVNVVDNDLATVAFSMNGNATWAKTRSTTVTVSDGGSGVNPSSLKYQWTTSTTAPTEASFTTTFTNGSTLNSPAGVTGTYYLWILAKDNAGNTTITSTNLFNLDNTNPSVPVTNFNGYVAGTWERDHVTLDFSATDTTSGIQKYQFSNDGANWYDVPNPYTIAWDVNTNIYTRAVDNAGNAGASAAVYVLRIDRTAPSVPVTNFNGYVAGTWERNQVTLNFSATDATSGIQKYQFSNDGANWYDVPNPYTIAWDVETNIYTRAVDNAGNAGASAAAYVLRIDRSRPVITMNGSNPANIVQGTSYTDAGASATDNLSGLASAVQVTSNVNPNVAGTYYVNYNVSDNAGNAAVQVTRTVNVISSATNFSYTGTVQTFVPAVTGYYKLEVWGASGASALNGRGGYATGALYMTQGTTYYVVVGGSSVDIPGGYNGGGYGGNGNAANTMGGGGGATHIATATGLLATLSGNQSAVKIVAGAGGGQGYNGDYYSARSGGYGGGTTGGNNYGGTGGTRYAYGGTQTAGGAGASTNGNPGSFGQGGNTTSSTDSGGYMIYRGGGGGGGWYGGGAGNSGLYEYLSNVSGGAGGSSYIGGVTTRGSVSPSTISGNTSMPAPAGGTETGHSGNGYARITYIGS